MKPPTPKKGKDMPLLEMKNISHEMSGRMILDDLSWTIRQGENWAVLGPNGAGKTTLLKIVCGYLWPNGGGETYRRGENHADLSALRRSMGWVTSTLASEVPQTEAVLRTVVSGKYAQIGLWEYFWERPRPEDFQKAEGYLKELGCGELAQRPFGTLSQGEQQKVLICRARMTEPYLIVLDEPCAGMDPGAREMFLSSLSLMKKDEGLPGLVYVTHHVEEILPLFNMTLMVREGKVLGSGATHKILTSTAIKRLYGITVELTKRNGRYWAIPLDTGPTA